MAAYLLVYNGVESNIEHLKRNILKEIESIDYILYPGEEESTAGVKMLAGFICTQIELLYVKKEESIVEYLYRIEKMAESSICFMMDREII